MHAFVTALALCIATAAPAKTAPHAIHPESDEEVPFGLVVDCRSLETYRLDAQNTVADTSAAFDFIVWAAIPPDQGGVSGVLELQGPPSLVRSELASQPCAGGRYWRFSLSNVSLPVARFSVVQTDQAEALVERWTLHLGPLLGSSFDRLAVTHESALCAPEPASSPRGEVGLIDSAAVFRSNPWETHRLELGPIDQRWVITERGPN